MLLENHGMSIYLETDASNWSSVMEDQLEDGGLFFNYRGYLRMSGFTTSNVDNVFALFKSPNKTIIEKFKEGL